ncbi:M14 family metallopeptidase [Bacillus sp. FJAT-22090]|uniref:M14 family metallopeptidase n=1 Tax=Bacillus sp. FJAT-22090 TaxID=1581038 RepID=UPI00119E0E02|nr:M14 family metallopeptidase [Bacillus sp. FJAT-22090]
MNLENLQKIWTIDGILLDKNQDNVIDGVSLFVDLPYGFMPEGLLDFFVRVGYETTALSYNFFEYNGQKVKMIFKENQPSSYIVYENRMIIIYYENEKECSKLLSQLSTVGVDHPIYEDSQQSVIKPIRSLADIWSFSGFGADNEASPYQTLSLNIDIQPNMKNRETFIELCHFVARAALYCTEIILPVTNNPTAKISFTIQSGEQTKLKLLKANTLKLEGNITGVVTALNWLNNQKNWSEKGTFGYWEQKIRLDEKKPSKLLLEEEWEDESEIELVYRVLNDITLLAGDEIEVFISEPLHIRDKLKQDIWMTCPQLKNVKVHSAFKTGFQWVREEILPIITEDIIEIKIYVKKEDNDACLELPIRWIQEMYPIDAYLEKYTHLNVDDITFYKVDHLEHTFNVYGTKKDGTSIQLGSLDVPIIQIPYVEEGKFAYPNTGAVRIYRNDNKIETHLIPTDRERFYLFYLNEFLPRMTEQLKNINEGQGVNRPLFDRIVFDVWMSEQEEKLFLDEERISSMEALYEDLYFNTLDYFAEWGKKKYGTSLDAPGGIYPFMHVNEDKRPKARIQVFEWVDYTPLIVQTTEIHFNSRSNAIMAFVSSNNGSFSCVVEKFKANINWSLPELSNFIEVNKELHIAYPDHSYYGLNIPIIECFLPSGEKFDASLKLTLFKKTIVIEAGHHANEVSSTPAVLRLAKELSSNKEYLKELNIIIIPLANIDGNYLLSKMIIEQPEWKHHAARYNAVGLEFAYVKYQQTVFGEANILPQVMRRWAPDIVVDNHGIPSHEWIQPFAGYNSPPRFPVSYFIPSAKIYGIGRISQKVNEKCLAENLEIIVQSINNKFHGTTIAEENAYWKARFIKYGHAWLPDVFPIEEASSINFYRQKSVTPTYPTVSILRYPEWVAADIISEAADEVVYGKKLESCVESQYLFNSGIIDVLKNTPVETFQNSLQKFRIRPLKLQLEEK